MKRIITKDNSPSFYSEEYEESYHSESGAREEAYKKFAEPSLKAADKDYVRILDVCFGLGYNSAAIIDLLLQNNFGCEIELTAIEKDPEILNQITSLEPGIKTYHIIQDLINENGYYDCEGIQLKLMKTDALKAVRQLKGSYDIILHDPFSPKKCPELWTEEFFKELRRLIADKGVLTTYSCAGQVRRNLDKAGFIVEDGPCIGRRAPSTIATPKNR